MRRSGESGAVPDRASGGRAGARRAARSVPANGNGTEFHAGSGRIVETGGGRDHNLVKALLVETRRVKDLYTQCSERGIAIEDAWPAVRSTKELVGSRRFLLALDRLRELKIELLAELLLWEQLPPENLASLPGEIANPLPSEAIVADLERLVPSKETPEARAPRPPTE